MNKCRRQVPEQSWTFVNRRTGETDSGILPKLGESNDFAYWDSRKKGHWNSVRFTRQASRRYTKGLGPSGLLGRMVTLLTWQRKNSKGYCLPNVSPEQMLEIWIKQNNLCAACGSHIDLLNSCFDHNHETGEPRGFIHKHCNIAEGCIAKMSLEEFSSFIKFIKSIRGV